MAPLSFLQDLWNESEAAALAGPLDLLRYRSNRLGDDLRITNFGGGNTSSKFELPDPLTGTPTRGLPSTRGRVAGSMPLSASRAAGATSFAVMSGTMPDRSRIAPSLSTSPGRS